MPSTGMLIALLHQAFYRVAETKDQGILQAHSLTLTLSPLESVITIAGLPELTAISK